MDPDEPLELIPYEEDGYFLNILFEGDDDPTLLYVTGQDFESLLRMADPSECDWESFRRELLLLLEHSGHGEEKKLSEERVERMRKILHDFSRSDSGAGESPS